MVTTKTEYDPPLILASHSVLLELAHLLRAYEEGIVVVGGSVPSLILKDRGKDHIGTIDIDLALDQTKIQEVGYRSIRELLLQRGYQESDQPFIFYRTIVIKGTPIKVEVDFLAAEYGGTSRKHRTQKVQDMLPRKARACDLAFSNPEMISIDGLLPDGGKDQAIIRVASIVPFLVMKAEALHGRLKEKDAYDIYFCLKNYPGGLDGVVEAFHSFPTNSLIKEGLDYLAVHFQSPEAIGPVQVVNFLEVTDPESREMLQRDSYEHINELLRRMNS